MKLFKTKCYNGGQRHKFEPRYTEVPRQQSGMKVKNMFPDDIRSLLYYQKYIHDVCVWCGKIISQ
jgi:hypothetical protein